MNLLRTLSLLLSLLLGFSHAYGDYGDVPPYQKMDFRLGLDWLSTYQNFAFDGVVEDLAVGNEPAQLNDWTFWMESEYGVAEDWSLGARAGFLLGTLNNPDTLDVFATGNGLTDAWLYSKWAFATGPISLALETSLKAPLGASRVQAADELVTGDGAFDLGLKLHSSSRIGLFRMFLSPGLLFRFNGYSSALTGDAGIQIEYIRGYARAFARMMYSFSENALHDSRLEVHDASLVGGGTGGSYTRLAGSPTFFGVGGKLGVLILPRFALEAHVMRTVFGERAPVSTLMGVNAVIGFDFIEPKKSVRIRELPFEEEEE